MRRLEYQLFAQIPTLPETFTTLARGLDGRVAVAAALWLALLVALWKAGPRHAWLFVAGGMAALVAVLPLARSWNHYGYAFAAVTAMVVAAAWASAPRWGRGVIALVALLNLAHGISVMLMIHRVGDVQAVFSPALANAVGNATPSRPLRLRPAPGSREWIFQRLTHEIPRYRGIAIGQRVQLVAADAPADYRIEADGRLTPLP